uniref:Uncharacterized protein n=1 Tax=Arundo donax TaxID=35708 RepID=A0A0A9HH08_ARUDO
MHMLYSPQIGVYNCTLNSIFIPAKSINSDSPL